MISSFINNQVAVNIALARIDRNDIILREMERDLLKEYKDFSYLYLKIAPSYYKANNIPGFHWTFYLWAADENVIKL